MLEYIIILQWPNKMSKINFHTIKLQNMYCLYEEQLAYKLHFFMAKIAL